MYIGLEFLAEWLNMNTCPSEVREMNCENTYSKKKMCLAFFWLECGLNLCEIWNIL